MIPHYADFATDHVWLNTVATPEADDVLWTICAVRFFFTRDKQRGVEIIDCLPQGTGRQDWSDALRRCEWESRSLTWLLWVFMVLGGSCLLGVS